jgi:hypothetical protein
VAPKYAVERTAILLAQLKIQPNQSLQPTALHSIHVYEVRPPKDKRGVNLISDALPFGGLWTSTIAFAYTQQRDFFMPDGAPSAEASPAARSMLIRGAHLRS